MVEQAFVPEAARDYVISFPELISLNDLHVLIDGAWDTILANHEGKISDAFLSEFYSHPVWALNAIFAESDPQSRSHRVALATQIRNLGISSVADIGGGSGTFLRILKSTHTSINCILCEPYIEHNLISPLQKKGIEWSAHPPENVEAYTLIDVLEHLGDPLRLVKDLVDIASNGSYFFFGNCFYPIIKCHLAQTFFLRRTFALAAKCMGLQPLGRVKDAEYIEIYRLERNPGVDPLVESLNMILPHVSHIADSLYLA
jgi:2-polyprenyl-6-hydroxyphenyl methylase/3-demethylubiquinone-9 3-methyltransferase